MAFDLKRVLKVMLFASNGPLSVKDIQTAISRFHDQATSLAVTDETEGGETPAVALNTPDSSAAAASPESSAGLPAATEPVTTEGAAATSVSSVDGGEILAPLVPPADNEFYSDVPTLVTTTQIREAMDAISDEMRATDSDVVLLESSNGWRLASHPRFALWVRLLRNEPPPVRLSASSLETLAVIAYRQPVTRAEIEQIRGVSAEAGVTKLLERDLIYVVGRADQPGRPLQFGTTDTFLEFVGIKSLDELPASDVLSPRQIDAWLQTSSSPHPSSDAEMGLDETESDQLTLDEAPEPAASEESGVEREPTAPAAAAGSAVENAEPQIEPAPERPEA
jgi:segregation and condensation protein B